MEKDAILFLNLPRARVLKGRISLSGVRSGHTVGETVGAAAVRFTDQKFRSEHSSDFEFAHACGQLFRYIEEGIAADFARPPYEAKLTRR